MSTYSSKPFILLDGEDNNGVRAEVKVIKGFGVVSAIEPTGPGKANNVFFSVENTKYKVTGHTPVDSNLMPLVSSAYESGEPIHFRIEIRRKKNLDRTLSMEEVTAGEDGRKNVFRSLCAVKEEGSEDWTISPFTVTRLEDDPKSGGNGLYSAYDMEDTKVSVTTGRNVSKSEAYEPAPYVSFLRDGRINPGSIAASVPLNMLSFLLEWDRDNPESQIGERKHAVAAKLMLSAANELQLSIWGGELTTPDLGSGSHTRARALVFEVTRSYLPLTPEIVASKESMLEWRQAVVDKGLAMWKWSISEAEQAMNIQ